MDIDMTKEVDGVVYVLTQSSGPIAGGSANQWFWEEQGGGDRRLDLTDEEQARFEG